MRMTLFYLLHVMLLHQALFLLAGSSVTGKVSMKHIKEKLAELNGVARAESSAEKSHKLITLIGWFSKYNIIPSNTNLKKEWRIPYSQLEQYLDHELIDRYINLMNDALLRARELMHVRGNKEADRAILMQNIDTYRKWLYENALAVYDPEIEAYLELHCDLTPALLRGPDLPEKGQDA